MTDINEEQFEKNEYGTAVIHDSALKIIGIGNCDDLTMHNIGDWVPCASVNCDMQFRLKQWWCGVSDGNREENEPWKDGGKDGLRFICYECAKVLYENGFLEPESYALLNSTST